MTDDEAHRPHQAHHAHASHQGHQGAKAHQTHSSQAHKAQKGAQPWHHRAIIVGPLILIVAVALIVGILIWRHSRTIEKTDDAYVDVVSEQVSALIAGQVTRVLVDDNQDVTAGQVLVDIDPVDYQTRVEQAAAARAQAEAQLAQAQAQMTVYAAQVEVAKANLGTAEANSGDASRQLERYRHLHGVNAGAVSAQQMDSAATAAKSAAAQLDAAHKSVAAAEAQLGSARSQEQAARAGIRSAEAQAREADVTLSRAQVKALVSGRVASKTVSPGNYVTPGAPLMAVVPKEVYVTADFKETQLDHLRPGQPVKIKVDAYPELKLTGRVASIEPATGQTFSLIPAENATGNWVKIVQRVAVKITFDQLPDDPGQRLAPGMSVEVWVTVR